jgi:hypothetical protein
VFFLILLPVSDLIPIAVVLFYHYKTMRNSAPYVPQANSKKSKHDRLYSIEDLDTESSTSLSSNPSGASTLQSMLRQPSSLSSTGRLGSAASSKISKVRGSSD